MTPDAQQLLEQAEQQVEPPDPIMNPLAYLTMLNQQSKKLSQDGGASTAVTVSTAAAVIATVAATITTAGATTVSVKEEPKSPLETVSSGVTIVSSSQSTVAAAVQGQPAVKCEDVPTTTTTCVSQPSSTGLTTTTATTSGETTTKQTGDTGSDVKAQSTGVAPS